MINTDEINRTITIGGEIVPSTAVEFISAIHKLDRNDGKIDLVFTGSEGGHWDDGALSMVDCIQGLKNDVIAYGYGMLASSAALLFLAADVRVLSPSSFLMVHDGSLGETPEKLREIEELAPLLSLQRERDYIYLSQKSCRPPSYWRERMNKDLYIFSEEALELELVQFIGYFNNGI